MGTQKTQRLTRWDQLDTVLAKEEAASRPLSLRRDDEEDIRLAMSSHFGKAGGGEDIGGEAEFESVEKFRVYKVELHCLYEKREAARRVRPHKGEAVPPPRVTEANLDPWACIKPPPAAYERGKAELPIDGSQELRQCMGCQGIGRLECDKCGGKGRLRCPCRNGTQSCFRCTGGLEKVSKGTKSVPKKCPVCQQGVYRGIFGTGEPESCRNCSGGTVYESVPDEQLVTCRTCGGKGRTACSTCDGTSVVPCAPPHGQCGGTGKLPCQKCEGSGQQVAYLAVVRSFTSDLVVAPVVGDGVPKAALRHMSEHGRFEPLLEIDTTDFREKLVPGHGSLALKRAVSKVFEGSAEKKPDGYRTVRQKLVVAMDRVLKVDYTHEGKSYTLWLMGEGMAVLAPDSPLTDSLRGKVTEAVGLWGEGDQKNAALALRDALDMCEKDPGCEAAYEELRDGIPRKLQERGKNATTLKRWVKRNPVVVFLLLFFLGPPLLLGCLGVGSLFVGFLSSGPSRPPADRREWEQRLAEDEKRRDEEWAKEVSVRFEDTSRFLEAGKSDRLRVAVRKKAFGDPLDRDIVLKLEAPSNLTLPASVKVEKGQLEVEIPVTAGKQTGKFRVKVVPEGLKNTETYSDTCTVTVTEPLKPPPPFPTPGGSSPDVSVQFTMFTLTLEAGKQGKLKTSIDRRNKEKASGDITLRFEAPASLKLPESVTVERGQVEAEVPVTAGDKAGKFVIKVIVAGLRNTDYADTATVTVTEAKVAKEPKQPEAKLTAADFLPHEPGRVRTYLQAAVQGRHVSVTEVEVTQKEGGVTESRVTRTGTLAGNDLKTGKVTWSKVPPPKAVLTIRHRVKDGVVEVGVQGKDKDDISWEPVLQFGKRWTWFTPGGHLKQYETVGFARHKDRNALVVRTTVTAGEAEVVTTSTYVKGVGEVERTTSATSGGSTAVVGQMILVEK